MRDRPTPPPSGPTYETILLDNREEAESMRLQIHRISPDPGMVEELDLLEHLADLDTVGKVRSHIVKRHYDGRQSVYKFTVNLDTEEEGPWRLTIPKDPLRVAEAEADHEAALAQIRIRRGLPPLPPQPTRDPYASPYAAPYAVPQALAAPVAPAPLASPPGFVSEEQVSNMIARAVADAMRAAATPVPQAPPAPPPPPAYFTREESTKMIADAVTAAMKPAAPQGTAMEQVQAAAKSAAETVATLNKTNDDIKASMGIVPVAPEAPLTADDPIIERNGIALSRTMLKSNPTGAMVAMNLPIVKGLIDGLKDGIKEVIREGAVAKREEVDLLNKENAAKEKQLNLAEREASMRDQGTLPPAPQGEASGGGSVVASGEWSAPRGRTRSNTSGAS